jgi:probable O-glycosylation ligase (exosortase A-associated)
MPLRDVFLLVFFIGSLPVCFVRPFYGVIMWTIVAFLNPQSYLWGFGANVPWALAVAIPTLAGFCLFGMSSSGLRSRNVALILILWAWFAVTSFVSVSTPLFMHHSEDTWARLIFVSKILLMTIVMIPIVSTFQRLRTLVIVVAASFGAFVAKSAPFVILSGGAFRVYGPANSMIGDNNDFGLALNMTLPLYFFLAQSETKPWLKRVFAILFILTIPVILFTYSRGALVGLIAVFCALLTFLPLKQRLVLIPVIGIGVALGLLLAPDSWRHRMDPTREDAIDASAQARLNVWSFSRNLAADYPITGGGFASFTPELFNIYGPPGQRAMAPHSVYFQLLAEHGYVGLTIYLILVLSTLTAARSLAAQARRRGDQTIGQYANMFTFGLVGFLTSGLFLGRAYFDYFFFMVACLIILKRIAEVEWSLQDNEEVQESVEDESMVALGGGDFAYEGGPQ